MSTVRYVAARFPATVRGMTQRAWTRHPTLWWGSLLVMLTRTQPVHWAFIVVPTGMAYVHLWLIVGGDIRREVAFDNGASRRPRVWRSRRRVTR